MKTAGLILAFAALACGKQPPPPPADPFTALERRVADLEHRLHYVEGKSLTDFQSRRAHGPKPKVNL